MAVSDELMNILACPKCRNGVRLDPEGDFIICDHCKLRYPVEDDIPVMLIDSAESID